MPQTMTRARAARFPVLAVMPGFARCLLLTAALLCPIAGSSVAAAKGAPGIFDSLETRKEGLNPFPKWSKALDKYFEEGKKLDGSCAENRFNKCHYQQWEKLLADLRDKDTLFQLRSINEYMNRFRYIMDPVNWNLRDYWESPGEFFWKFGDCEDYSIAKYLSLRRLGVAHEMRVVVLQDLNLNVAHAVLAVYVKGTVYILDNQLRAVVESDRIRHYRPIFSLNETGWWKHQVASR